MRQLRTCDFCGDEAAGTFEIVPPELDPTEAEQRRVVLCTDCQPILEELIEPLLARARADGASDTTSSEPGPEDEPVDTAGFDDESVASAGTGEPVGNAGRDEPVDSAPTDDEPDGSTTIEADTDGSARSIVTGGSDAATRDDGDGSGTPGLAAGGEDDESVVPDAVVTPDTSDVPGPGPDDGVAIGGGAAERDHGADESGPSDAGSAQESGTDTGQGTATGDSGPATDTPGAPRAYRKVIRLLQNREFPMARSEVEALAGSAYDLEDHEVTAIINHAVKQGRFELEGRQIRRA